MKHETLRILGADDNRDVALLMSDALHQRLGATTISRACTHRPLEVADHE